MSGADGTPYVCKADIACDEGAHPCDVCETAVCYDHAHASHSGPGYYCSKACAAAPPAERESAGHITIPSPPPLPSFCEPASSAHPVAVFWSRLNKACAAFCGSYIDGAGRGAAEINLRRILNEALPPEVTGAKLRVIIESPFGTRPDGTPCTHAEMAQNMAYFWACVRDSLRRGEAPFGSHGFYPCAGLDDSNPEERRTGIAAGFAWAAACELRVFYLDRGVTRGMTQGRDDALSKGQHVETRRLRLSEGVPAADLELCVE